MKGRILASDGQSCLKKERSTMMSTSKQKRVWHKAVCPICGEGYQYLDYKPATCGKFQCLQAALRRGLLK